MLSTFVEATNGPRNWGKFMVARWEQEEWQRRSAVDVPESALSIQPLLLPHIGWAPDHVIVFDLQTCEGAAFSPGGSAHHDLEKHRIWVCPMFEPFLEWLYQQDLKDLHALPRHVDLPDAPFALSGYRRPGPEQQ